VLVGTASGAGLTLNGGTSSTPIDLTELAFSGTGNISNLGFVKGSTLTLPGDFVNGLGASAEFDSVTIGGRLLNSGHLGVMGTVTVAGSMTQQLAGDMTIASGGKLVMNQPSGVFRWVNGTIGGAGGLEFLNGSEFEFFGNGDRVINGLNFSFPDLTLPNGSLTVRSGSLTLGGNSVLPAGVDLNLEGGTLTLPPNSSLAISGDFNVSGGAFTGPGNLNMAGGSLSLSPTNTVAWTNSGALTNTGTLNLAGSTITNAIDNQGTINLGGGLTFTQPLTNRGTLNVQSGTSSFSGGVQQQSGDVVLSGGTLQGDLTLATGSLRGNGTVDGTVTIGTVTMSPGASPGKLMVTGNLVLNAASVVSIELGGTVPTTGYDWIQVGGTATLAGTLNVSQIGGFVAPPGSSFSILQFASSTGAFSAGGSLPATVTLSYTPTAVLLSGVPVVIAPPPLPPLPPLPPPIPPDEDLPPGALPGRDRNDDTVPGMDPEPEIEVEGCR
jgi:hypothetical protein